MEEGSTTYHNELLGLVRELKNPLISIAAQADMAPGDSYGSEFIRQEALFLLETIDELLLLHQPVKPKTLKNQTDLKTVLLQVSKRLEAQLKTSKAKLKTNLPLKLPIIRADTEQVSAIISCLLKNSVRQSPKELEITVKATVKNNFIQIKLSDQISVIKKSDYKRLITNFGQETTHLPHHPASSGLFLYIANKLAVTIGGHLGLASSSDNKTIYVLNLPTSEQLRLF